jgi:hypothetical protein
MIGETDASEAFLTLWSRVRVSGQSPVSTDGYGITSGTHAPRGPASPRPPHGLPTSTTFCVNPGRNPAAGREIDSDPVRHEDERQNGEQPRLLDRDTYEHIAATDLSKLTNRPQWRRFARNRDFRARFCQSAVGARALPGMTRGVKRGYRERPCARPSINGIDDATCARHRSRLIT